MESFNYHHLRLFWAVAHEGNLTRASKKLHLAPQTVSTQIRDFEKALGENLFRRSGRRLLLTDVGHVALRYADEIFSLGQELREALRGQPSGRPLRLVVGVADVLPKLVAHRLIEPALLLEEPVRIVCREGTPEKLLADLAVHGLDVVLSDAPIPPGMNVRAYNHELGRCGVTFMAQSDLASRLRKGFPTSLEGAPVLLPSEDTVVRRELDQWFDERGVRPVIAGEFEDSALLKVFGQAGTGFFAVPTVIEDEVVRQYEVEPIGATTDVSERFYAISVERRVRHPAVMAICEAARSELFT
ncbi:MAG: transcriptional activator NhaR [Deltaproteobacteria bacterium]|nr:transcriptional activator NhaR [Deltaproteobacteria bacterium]MBW2379906.1 transcriptional activator NhaR [Deltaproteobacteria bacterium]MBW2550757.1 transcriptional activator NhaR [Deltaproteobacteria bacterium]MBW2628121.1 transcriptional activator NhaR [Deltaproteobacteria bacterium]MBW2685480.1 transcriptional activator NhaR [Deltaproteobacteria bacterium]